MEIVTNSSSPGSSKKRRHLGNITSNACTLCRKKRTKCDGQIPCERCNSHKVECVYEAPVRHSKEQMRNELESLRLKVRQQENFISTSLSKNFPSFHSEQSQSNEPMRLLDDESGTLFCDKRFSGFRDGQIQIQNNLISSPLLKSSGSSQKSMITYDNVPRSSIIDLDDKGKTNESLEFQKSLEQSAKKSKDSDNLSDDSMDSFQSESSNFHSSIEDSNWTTVTNDRPWIDNLLSLYFCWEYPIFSSLSKDQFQEDFLSGKKRYCSSLLVNAVLSVGCRFSDNPKALTDPNNSRSSGDDFFAEAVRILNAEDDRQLLTTIQALGLLSIREASCGRSCTGIFYSGQSIRLAIEMGLHKDMCSNRQKKYESIEYNVRLATFWGAFSLDQAWSLSTGRLPIFSEKIELAIKPNAINHLDCPREPPVWTPYTENGIPNRNIKCENPSNRRNVFAGFCKLSEIVHKTLYTVYSPILGTTSGNLLEIYTEYLDWYDSVPDITRLGQDFTPPVLFSHSTVLPHVLCAQAAEAISSLITSYSRLYTLRRVPSFLPYIALSSSITQLVVYSDSGSGIESLLKGFSNLREMSYFNGFAVISIHILRFLARLWGVKVSVDPEGEFPIELKPEEFLTYEMADHKNTCSAITTTLNQFCPHDKSINSINNLSLESTNENQLFSPFTLQGRPSLDIRPEKFEKSGFSSRVYDSTNNR